MFNKILCIQVNLQPFSALMEGGIGNGLNKEMSSDERICGSLYVFSLVKAEFQRSN